MRLGVWSSTWLLGLVTATVVEAQAPASGPAIPRSQKGSVTQSIAGTNVSITYSRPVARGRTLFGPGGVVQYGREWCPGADRATSIELSGDLMINGQLLRAGKYSIWAIPNQDEWTWIFSNAADVFHTPYPRGQDALRFTVIPTRGDRLETMTYYFPMVDADSAAMRFHWGETVVQLQIKDIGKGH